MTNVVINFFLIITFALWSLSWTNFLSDTYNFWGLMVWAGEFFNGR